VIQQKGHRVIRAESAPEKGNLSITPVARVYWRRSSHDWDQAPVTHQNRATASRSGEASSSPAGRAIVQAAQRAGISDSGSAHFSDPDIQERTDRWIALPENP
jgi:hypothetical protein